MTNDNKFVPSTPKTFQVAELKEQQIKKSPLSAAARNKVINRSGINYLSENQDYGPCSYWGCSYPNVPFDISISVDGLSRNWACRPHIVNYFPGSWTYSPHILGSYSWRENLWLNRIDQARDAIRSMDNDNLFVVNAPGLFCVENGKFCNNAKSILNECISHHERGDGCNLTHTIQSDIYNYAKIATITAASFFAPGATAASGAVIWGTFKAAEHHPDANEYDKQIFRSNSSFGGDMFKAGAVGSITGKISSYLNADGQKLYKLYNDATGIAEPASEALIHKTHGGSNNYHADCPVCNPDN